MAHRYADYDDDDDPDPFDERGLLKDGRTSRTSLMMKDGLSDVQRSIAQDAVSRRFDDSAARHQLGPIYFDRSAAREAYEDARRESEQAWKMLPTPTEAADRRKRKVTARDPFGRESGTWEEDAASDDAPVGPTYDVAEGRRRKQAAYDAMVADLTGAWRNPSPLPGGTDAAPPERQDAAPVPRTMTADAARRIKQAAYNEMVDEMTSAWKGPAR